MDEPQSGSGNEAADGETAETQRCTELIAPGPVRNLASLRLTDAAQGFRGLSKLCGIVAHAFAETPRGTSGLAASPQGVPCTQRTSPMILPSMILPAPHLGRACGAGGTGGVTESLRAESWGPKQGSVRHWPDGSLIATHMLVLMFRQQDSGPESQFHAPRYPPRRFRTERQWELGSPDRKSVFRPESAWDFLAGSLRRPLRGKQEGAGCRDLQDRPFVRACSSRSPAAGTCSSPPLRRCSGRFLCGWTAFSRMTDRHSPERVNEDRLTQSGSCLGVTPRGA